MFGSCLVFVLVPRCVGCCQPFVTEAASDVSDVDQMDMWFVEVELCQFLVSEAELDRCLWLWFISQFCGI